MSVLSGPGGSSLFIRYNSSVQYSTDQNIWYDITFPCTIQNTNSSAGVLTIEFITDLILSSVNDYFICGSTHIQFGSSSLNTDGTRPVITIDGVTNYPGLIRNGFDSIDESGNGYSNIYVYNLVVVENESTLFSDGATIAGGWIGQAYFGKESMDNYIVNCSSSGPIPNCGGGILGSHAGIRYVEGANVTIRGCSSSGVIGGNGGGIAGQFAAYNGGTMVTCESCWSTGTIYDNGGGILGAVAGNASGSIVIVTNCYSEGYMYPGAGGICGTQCGGFNGFGGSVTISNCYSKGDTSLQAGGIVGGSCANTTITNCYSTGAIADTAGGIVGYNPSIGPGNITNCYTTGTVTGMSLGYIISGSGTIPATCYGEGTGSWNSTNANNTLQGTPAPTVGTTWINRGLNQSYELREMGYTPYTTLIISPTSELVKTYSQSVQKGQSTIQAVTYDLSGNQFTILQGANGITMNLQTGAISTETNIPSGTYTVVLRSVGSYNITEFILTVTDTPNTEVPCCKKENFLRGPIDGNTVTELREGNTLIGYMRSRRGLVPSSALLAIKKAYAFKR